MTTIASTTSRIPRKRPRETKDKVINAPWQVAKGRSPSNPYIMRISSRFVLAYTPWNENRRNFITTIRILFPISVPGSPELQRHI